MSQRETVEPSVDEYGSEVHPAFGMISASRMTSSVGQVLFQSDIKHRSTVVIRLARASRKRDLHHDYVHPGEELFEVELSEAQWASFVSAMNTTGVPATIRRTQEEVRVPELPYDPRLAHSMTEVRDVADRLFAEAREAMAAYEKALADKAPAKVRGEALRKLHYALENSEPNITFASDSLIKHSEDVVQKARADIEAFVTQKSVQLGLDAGESALLELPAFTGEVEK